MNINTKQIVSISEANQNFSKIARMADKYGELAKKNAPRKVFLCQADCMDDAQLLVKMLGEKYKVDVDYIADIGPVIGAHAGPGTLAVFFIGENR